MTWRLLTALAGLAILARIAQAGEAPKTQKDYEKIWREARIPTALDRLRDTTHRPVNPKALAASERLQKASDQSKEWLVRWDTTTGCQAGLAGGRFWGRGATRKEQATNFLSDYFDLFWQPDSRYYTPKPELRFARDQAASVSFDVYSQGFAVFRARLVVLFERDGSIGSVNGWVPILGEADLSPKLSPKDAAEAVRRSWKTGKALPENRIPHSPELVIYPSRPPRLMYSVYVADGPHLLVDANTGEIFPGMWKGPLYFRGAIDSTTREGVRAETSPSGHPLQPRKTNRRVSTSRDSVLERLRCVDGMEYQIREPPAVPLPRPGTPPALPAGRVPIPIIERRTGDAAARADTTPAIAASKTLLPYYIDDIMIASPLDKDGDGYARQAYLVVDIDIAPPGTNGVVYIVIFGRELSLPGSIQWQSGQFPLVGVDEAYEWFGINDLPHGHWDFRINVYTYDGLLVASSTYGQFPGVMGVALETAWQDAAFGFYDAYADGVYDWNRNGYFCTMFLSWALTADVGIHSVYGDLYISDGVSEWFLPTTEPYLVTDTGHVWQYLAFAGKPHGYYQIRLVLFEAGTNQFLREFSYGEHSRWTNIPLETGREDKGPSQVFSPNPVNTHNNPCLWDHHDSASAVPAGAYTVVELDSLNEPPFEDGFYQLSGAYANIAEIRTPAVPPPWLPGPSYAYTRDQAGFEPTMAYYHITANQEYVQSLNMGYSVCDRQVDVDVFGNHPDSITPGTTSWYHPDPPGAGYIVFGYNGYGGSPGVDHAEDADVILHEYGHAILDNIAPATFYRYDYNYDPLCMNEGFANYWAASSTYEASVAHGFPPEYVGEWYVKNAPGCQPAHATYGNVDNQWTLDSLIYPYEEHRGGQPWAGALWDMLQTFGKTVADRIIVEGHRRASGMVDFSWRDVLPKLLSADSVLYGAAHSQQIINIFAARGINVSVSCDCPHQGDLNADDGIDVFDVIAALGIAFSGEPDFADPGCPTSRTDVNYDLAADVFDVIYLIGTAFSGGDSPCNPCTPGIPAGCP